MKRKIELLLAFLLLSISCAFAQKLTVKGTVLDETGQSIIGATVREKGVATNGASTDLDGHFTLTVNQGALLRRLPDPGGQGSRTAHHQDGPRQRASR